MLLISIVSLSSFLSREVPFVPEEYWILDSCGCRVGVSWRIVVVGLIPSVDGSDGDTKRL